mmetsp:Transcript_7552/g.13622  ORF Transcript_7552/g.13622 Transcript_7552/m.13622 type:complete len:87 (-) Transcript_7552:129-389(-)
MPRSRPTGSIHLTVTLNRSCGIPAPFLPVIYPQMVYIFPLLSSRTDRFPSGSAPALGSLSLIYLPLKAALPLNTNLRLAPEIIQSG